MNQELQKFIDEVIMTADDPMLEAAKFLKLVHDNKVRKLKEKIADLERELYEERQK